MKIKVEVGKGWCSALIKCLGCNSEFTLIRSKKLPFRQCSCPNCRYSILEQQEDWWKGLIEVETDDECS